MAPATACPRCGTFAELSEEVGQRLCVACHRVVRATVSAENRSAAALISRTFALWRESFWVVTLLSLGTGLPMAWLTFDGAPWWARTAVSTLVGSYVEALALCLVMSKAVGGNYRLNDAFDDSTRRYLSVLGVNAVASVLTTAGLCACGIGLFAVSALLMQAVPLALIERVSTFEALKLSFARSRGPFLPLLAGSALFFVLSVSSELALSATGVAIAMRTGSKTPAEMGEIMLQLRPAEALARLLGGALIGGAWLYQLVAWSTFRPEQPTVPATL